MRIRRKRQITIPQAVDPLSNTTVEFGKLPLRPAEGDARTSYEAALKTACTVPLTKAFRGKSTDEIMEFLRGE